MAYSRMEAFHTHKANAKGRGIEFLFTFEEYVVWWEEHLGRNWLKLRGCRSDQYCMARKGDKGPYALWNVECITNAQNRVDAIKNGARGRGPSKKPTAEERAKIEELLLRGKRAFSIAKELGIKAARIRHYYPEGGQGCHEEAWPQENNIRQ